MKLILPLLALLLCGCEKHVPRNLIERNYDEAYTNKPPSYMIPDGQTNAGRWVWLPIRDADIIAWGSRQQGFSLNHVQWTNGEGGTLIWTPYQTREIEEP